MGCASAIAVISVNVLTRHTCSSEQRPTTEPTVYGKAGRQKAVRPDQASCVKRPLRRCLPVIFRSPKPRKHSGPATRMHGPLSGVAAGSTSIVDEIDARLARLGRRIEARSAGTRALLADAGCLELAEAARETFGALRIAGSLVGKPDPEWTRWPRHTAADMASARPDSVGRKRR